MAEDSAAVRRALRTYLSARKIPVCGEAEDGEDAIERAGELEPDVVLLDLAMPKLNGLETALILKRRMPKVRTVLYTMYSEAVSIAMASKLTCFDAVVAKSDGMEKLAQCVEGLLNEPRKTIQ